MRQYATIDPAFWMRGTGKALRGDVEAQLVALYLMSSPHANMVGIYYLPLPMLVHETGLTFEGASKGLRRLSESGFVEVDEETDYVFVPNLAKHQVGETLSPKDNRRTAVVRLLRELGDHPFVAKFIEKYRDSYALDADFAIADSSDKDKGLRRGFEGASKPENREQGSENREQRAESRESAARSSPALASPEPGPPSFGANALAAVVSAEVSAAGAGSYPADIPLGTHQSDAIAAANWLRAEARRLGRPAAELCAESVRDYLASDFARKQRGRVSMTAWFREPARNAPWARSGAPPASGNQPSAPDEFRGVTSAEIDGLWRKEAGDAAA